MRLPAHPQFRRTNGLIVLLSLLVACSNAPDPTPPADVPTTTTAAAGETTTTVAATTTTADPASELLSVGTAWVQDEPFDGEADLRVNEVAVFGDTVWVVGGRDNGPLAMRSVGGGPLEAVDVDGPPSSGSVGLSGVAVAPDGTILLFGQRGSDCYAGLTVEGGYVRATLCRVTRGITYVSTDDGATFTASEPPEMALGGRQAVRLVGGTHDGEQFVVAGTLRADDWHGRIWTSPDGITWDLATELLSNGDVPASMSAVDVHHDGSTYLVVADEHPCAVRPRVIEEAGYVLGTGWPHHLRLYTGTDLGALVPVTNADLSLAPAPAEVDCAADEVDGFWTAQIPYPSFRAALVGGVFTVVDVSATDAGRAPGTHDIARFVDGEWVMSTFDVATATVAASDPDLELDPETAFDFVDVVDLDGDVALVGRTGTDVQLRLATPDGDAWRLVVADTNFALEQGDLTSAVSVGGELWTFGSERRADYIQSILRWRSWPMTRGDVPQCEPRPGAPCSYQDLTLLDGYPDFSGVDWSGIDLRHARLGAANLDGASLRGARLGEAESEPGASFVGTDLSDADLTRAELWGLDDVALAGADLYFARLYFTGLPQWDGATLAFGRLFFDPDLGPLDLSGLDLTDVTVRAEQGGERLVIADLSNAIVEGLTPAAVRDGSSVRSPCGGSFVRRGESPLLDRPGR